MPLSSRLSFVFINLMLVPFVVGRRRRVEPSETDKNG